MKFRNNLFLVTLFWLATAPLAVHAESRIALVVGIGKYEHAQTLRNPPNDAIAVAKLLEGLGFEVTTALDADQESLGHAVAAFEQNSQNSDVALFYFAGHGIQLQGRNFLLSSTAKVSNPHAIGREGLELDKIMEMMGENSQTSIAIVDACRDNPLAEKLAKNAGVLSRTIGISRGLAPITRKPTNSLIMFATASGDTAADGNGKHSPFTEALLKNLTTLDLEVSVMLKRVIQDVLTSTEGLQKPEVVSSMSSEFYFAPKAGLSELTSMSKDVSASIALEAALELAAPEARGYELAEIVKAYPDTLAARIAKSLLYETSPELLHSVLSDKKAKEAIYALNRLHLQLPTEASSTVGSVETTPKEKEEALDLRKDEIGRIQLLLNALGFDTGSVDGALGAKSRKGIKAFQSASNVPASGFLTQETIGRILEIFDETPKSYDGEWTLRIERKLLRNDAAGHGKKGDIQSMVVLNLVATDGEFAIENFFHGTVKPTNPFADFVGRVDGAGNVSFSGQISYLHGENGPDLRLANLSKTLQIPDLVQEGDTFATDANGIDRNYRFYLTLSRGRAE